MFNTKITAIILAKNEKDTIGKCIDSVIFCDEIIVIDDYSTDQTLEIATAKGVKVVRRKSGGDFASQRNFAESIAAGEWILHIDADEIVSEKLKNEILTTINDETIHRDAFYIKRRDWFWGKELKYGEVWSARYSGIIRLMKKKSGVWRGVVHETYIVHQKTDKLSTYLDHYPHQSIREFLNEINIYSSIRARELIKSGGNPIILAIFTYPFFKFIYTYFLKLGFLDGAVGFVYSFIMSFHSFLVRSKVYQYKKFHL